MRLKEHFRSPSEVYAYALAQWKLHYRRTCHCPDGSGFREESYGVECSCGAKIEALSGKRNQDCKGQG